MADIDQIERLAKGDESVVTLSDRMNLLLAAAELRAAREAFRRLDNAGPALTIKLSTGEYIAVDDVRAILKSS
jgi:hypothetical protein